MKTLDDIQTIAVVGAGTMGVAIAQIAAMAGYKTVLYDIEEDQLKKAEGTILKNLNKGIEKGKVTEAQKAEALAQLSYTNAFNDLKADVIIEAIVEKLAPKKELFNHLAQINDDDTIFATNTSSIPITQIAATIPHPGRVVGMHFFNPAHIMKLVEVIAGAATDETVAQTVKALADEMGKTAVMAKDSPGFIVNRVARHFYVEGLKVLEEQVASHDTIDDLMVASGFRMGPFRLMDLVGNDINFSVTSSLFESFYYDSKFRPSRVQQQKVDAGHLGRKTGKGFYGYE